MSDQYRWELREVLGCPFLRVLAPKGAEKTFLDKFAEKRQNREAAVYVAKTLQQVVRDGIARSESAGDGDQMLGLLQYRRAHARAAFRRADPSRFRQHASFDRGSRTESGHRRGIDR